jgi:hypothetical protein
MRQKRIYAAQVISNILALDFGNLQMTNNGERAHTKTQSLSLHESLKGYANAHGAYQWMTDYSNLIGLSAAG